MSIVLSYANEKGSFIISDTRVGYSEEVNSDKEYIDGNQKVYDINASKIYGWCAGVGIGNVIESFKGSINMRLPKSIHDINQYFLEEVDRFKDINGVEDTTCCISLYSHDEESFFIFEVNKPFAVNNKVILMKEHIRIHYPSDYFINEQNLMKKDIVIHTTSFDDALLKSLESFKEVNEISKTVSRDCYIGFFFLEEGIYYKTLIHLEDFVVDKIINNKVSLFSDIVVNMVK